MRRLIVSISDMKLASRPTDILVTHSLGSCLGMTAYDPAVQLGGMIHCLLPKVPVGQIFSVANPFMYVDCGVPLMIRRMLARGAAKERLIFKAAGCAQMMGLSCQFDIGGKNIEMLEMLFNKNNVSLAAKDVGGNIPRTMTLDMQDGRVTISSHGKHWQL